MYEKRKSETEMGGKKLMEEMRDSHRERERETDRKTLRQTETDSV